MGGDSTPKATAAKEPQPNAAPSTASPAYPDWSGYQAFPPIAPHGFFSPPMTGNPQAHPYMWGAQHMMPPYGTPPPYVMYPPGTIYAHPSMPPGAHPFGYPMPSNGNANGAGSTPCGSGKNNDEPGKTSGASANGATHSSDNGSESSSGSEADSQNDGIPKRTIGKKEGRAQNGASDRASRAALGHMMPVVPVHQPGMDERELKRQKRKQSNRESARRSRLRKQIECEELTQRAEALKVENATLQAELERIKKEYDELLSQNNILKEKLGEAIEPATDKKDQSPTDDSGTEQSGQNKESA